MHVINSLGYQVVFDDTLASLRTFLAEREYSKILVLVDRNTNDHCLPILQMVLNDVKDYDIIEVDPGEENKNIDFCIGVWKTMLDFGADRKSLMINLGGGVVTDMGGFAASTFKRGLEFIQIPTTLLSQVDASVGGKTGIDLDNVKNIIGTFTQPQAVFINTNFLHTLDNRQLNSGFAEVIKHGLIFDRDLYNTIKGLTDVRSISTDIIFRSVEIKNEVITQDPTEKGLRKILNFGHTIGHAIEGFSLFNDDQPLLHGEAIAIGMICEGYLSHKLTGLSKEELDDLIATFRNHYPDYRISIENYDEFIALMKNDKKNAGSKIGFALLTGIGSCTYDHYVEEELIIESLDFYRELISE
ncbi:3-dehydroquinate synthase [Sphingobacterium spiritivorum ATCC 33300]|uniref:3-dehydroquinate synthase n=1 Tax=Sphingobacterium spiritivorum ATCC 33300 TaxID=525372 RepID=C2FVV2_SPHSI|nr:3-dehydroquinate synthase [Sphingobacterium spiritivorum]EEI92944.1 3-dehydroquinate synthase [Sphingobacterium spiritivorum ATCC 33300]QQS96292.1 3-dehydroquinate synthase [Sphingobacterium spiritivorum]